MRRFFVLSALVAAIGACGGDAATGPVPTDQLHFLQLAIGAPVLANPTMSFWAYHDRDTEARIYYHAVLGAPDSAELLDFVVPSGALSRRPDGSPFGTGDSVLVTITVIDPLRMIAEFEPSGLEFSTSNPAHLTVWLSEADPDLNGDGHVDAQDATVEAQLAIWREEQAGDPWTRLSSHVDTSLGDVSADVTGFSNYAVAY